MSTKFDLFLISMWLCSCPSLIFSLAHLSLSPNPSLQAVQKLRRVLVAYSWQNPNVGYCQGMNLLAALALLFLDEVRTSPPNIIDSFVDQH
jgi:hypothetical protein